MDNTLDKFEFGKHSVLLEKKFNNHANASNPHGIDKYKVGLGNVDNTADIDKEMSAKTKEYVDGSAWTIEATEISGTGSLFEISLKDNNDNVISSTLINTDSQFTIESIELDLENKRLIFNRGESVDPIYCDISELIDEFNNQVAEEHNERIAAEEELNNRFADACTEILEREIQDTEALNDKILSIYNSNESGEESGVLVDRLDDEKSLREQSDELLDQKIDNEVNNAVARENAIEQRLSTALNSETDDRHLAETALQQSINDEVTARETALENETNRATNIEVSLSNRLTTIEGNGDGSISKAVADEATRATGRENELEGKISEAVSTAAADATNKANAAEANAETNAKAYTFSQTDITAKDAATLTSAKEYVNGKETAIRADLTAHVTDDDNPHSVTKAQVGLGNADNTSDADKPISTATQSALDTKVDKIEGKGLSANDYDAAAVAEVAKVANKVDKVTGKSLIADTEITRLAGMSDGANKVESSETNGKIKIDGVETTVYTEVANTVHDAAYQHITVTANSVSDGTTTFTKYDDTLLAGRVLDLEKTPAHGIKATDITAWNNEIGANAAAEAAQGDVDALENIVGDSANGLVKDVADLKAVGAQANIIEKVQVNSTDLAITDKTVNVVIPAQSEYSIVKDDSSGDSAPIYHLTKDGTNIGVAINIPKDLVVESGSVVDHEIDGEIVKCIELVLNDTAKDKIYIRVDSMLAPLYEGLVETQQDVFELSEGCVLLRGRVSNIEQTLAGVNGTDWNNGKLRYFFNKLNGLTKNQIDALFALIENIEYSEESSNSEQ